MPIHERGADRPSARPDFGGTRDVSSRESPANAPRIAEIRRRVTTGAYDEPEIMRSVARRILDRRDL
jgi:hypothetical protein